MADITSNLVAHWNLNETSGTTLADSSGNGYSLTTANSPTLGGTTIGGALSTNVAFNGTNQRATRSSTSVVRNVGAATVAFWFKPTSTAASKWAFTLTGGTNQNRASVQLIAGGALRIWGRAGDAETAQSLLTSGGAVTAGAWSHVVAVLNYAGDTIACYINGSLLSSGSVSFTAAATSDTNATTIAVASDGASDYLACSFDDVRIYNRALAADDVAALYDLAKPQNTVAPGVTGDCIVGQTLSGTSGTWTDGSVNARKWQSADDGSGTNAADIGGATSADFTITESELNKYVRYAVQYSNGIGTAWAYSSWMGSIESAASLYRPRCPSFSLSLPTLSLG